MNKDNASKWIELGSAMLQGKTIQRMNRGEWVNVTDLNTISYDPESYRIKPEPKKIHLNIAFHKDKSGYWCRLVTGNTVTDLARVEQSDSFVKWLDHLEYELPEGDA